jgi:hypothetical protein
VELAALDQRGQHRPVFRAFVAAGKQSILSAKSNRTHCALNSVGVDFNAAVIEEAYQPVPAAERIPDGLGDRRAAGNLCQGLLEPGPQRFDERFGFLLSRRAALVGAVAADLGFDLVAGGNFVGRMLLSGNYGLVSTAEDYIRFTQMLVNYGIDPRAIRLPQYKPAPLRQGPMVRIHLPPAVSQERTVAGGRRVPRPAQAWLAERGEPPGSMRD